MEVTKEEAEGVDTLRYSFIRLQSKAVSGYQGLSQIVPQKRSLVPNWTQLNSYFYLQRQVQDELVHVQPKFKENLLSSVTIFKNDVGTFAEQYETVILFLIYKQLPFLNS